MSGKTRMRLMAEAERAALVADYVSGMRASQVAEKYGVSLTTVLDRLRKAGVTRPLGKVTPEDVGEMARLRGAGCTYQEIGERFGVTRVAVKRRLDQYRASSRDQE